MDGQQEQTSDTSRAWLLWAIKEQCAGGQELITESNAIGRSRRYKWLLDQLEERVEVEIIRGYHKRRRAEANERTWEQKRRNLARIEENLAIRRENRQRVGLQDDDSYSLRMAEVSVTEEEAEELLRYLEYLRWRKGKGAAEHGGSTL